jgi:dTDP-4-amino-4,6-dideoxygalactose transaminase
MRQERETVARMYTDAFRSIEEVEVPAEDPDRIHSWHLYPLRLRVDQLSVDRNTFLDALKRAGVGCSVHWRPLHLHPYYETTFGWSPDEFPVSTRLWERLVSLPIFPGMRPEEVRFVIQAVETLCLEHKGRKAHASAGER